MRLNHDADAPEHQLLCEADEAGEEDQRQDQLDLLVEQVRPTGTHHRDRKQCERNDTDPALRAQRLVDDLRPPAEPRRDENREGTGDRNRDQRGLENVGGGLEALVRIDVGADGPPTDLDDRQVDDHHQQELPPGQPPAGRRVPLC